MKPGKISESTLKRSVLRPLSGSGKGVLKGPSMSGDSAVVSLTGETCLVTSVDSSKGKQGIPFAVVRACNNVLMQGGTPFGLELALFLPETMPEPELKEMTLLVKKTAETLSVTVLGGHTEVLSGLEEVLFSVTAIGFSKAEWKETTLAEGMDLVLTRTIAMEATYVLAKENREALLNRLSADYVDSVESLEGFCFLKNDVEALRELSKEMGGLVMHDLSRGGVLGALWEFLEDAKLGMEADIRKIPILQETVEICETLGKNPYLLPSAGSILIGCEKGEELVRNLEEKGIPSAVIGTVTGTAARILKNGTEVRYLDRPDYSQTV